MDWPCTRHAATLDWNLPFFKDQRVFETQTAPAVWAELRRARLPDGPSGGVGAPAQALPQGRHGGGRGRRTSFARAGPISCSCTSSASDSHQHLYGPRSPEAYWAIEYIDGLIGQVLDALPGRRARSRHAVFVVSDHGFLPVEREIRVNVHLRRLGLLAVDAEGRSRGARRGWS